MIQLRHWRHELPLRHPWAIASSGRAGGKTVHPVVFVEVWDGQGRRGIGEASPSTQYAETPSTVAAYLDRVDPRRLSFEDLEASRSYLASLEPVSFPGMCAVDLALNDGAAAAAGVPVHEFLGVRFEEGRHSTSMTIGIDTPEKIERKVAEASAYPVLKLKVGVPGDAANLAAVRRVAPSKRLRVDANAAWRTREEALRRIEELSAGGGIEFVEQPMPPELPDEDWVWLKERSPLPIFGDELFHGGGDVERCARCVHGVNLKLVKAGGLTAGRRALEAARAQGLRTMIGCMIESSVLISAGAHLAGLADFLDLDGHVLIAVDPYRGVVHRDGRLYFGDAENPVGLRVTAAGERRV